ncbi:hypothetical protein CN193_26905, partial [Sinorhizobium meliloti]
MPLTLTLSPLAGRGDESVFDPLRLRRNTRVSPLPARGERARVRGKIAAHSPLDHLSYSQHIAQ